MSVLFMRRPINDFRGLLGSLFLSLIRVRRLLDGEGDREGGSTGGCTFLRILRVRALGDDSRTLILIGRNVNTALAGQGKVKPESLSVDLHPKEV